MSIGKSSLARAAVAAGGQPEKPAAPVMEKAAFLPMTVAVAAVAPTRGDAWQEASAELVASVQTQGVREPLLLAKTPSGALLLLAGAARLAAATLAGLDTVPAVVTEMTAAEAAALRRELKRFGKTGLAARPQVPAVKAGKTAVGDPMPDWLL